MTTGLSPALLPKRIRDRIEVCRDTGCWLWVGRWNSGNGYGKVRWEGRIYVAHRLVYELLIGPIPGGRVLDHKCRTRPCCNPEHVEPVTIRINTYRGEAVLFTKGDDRGRETHRRKVDAVERQVG